MLKLFKTSPNKLFYYDCVTLYLVIPKWGFVRHLRLLKAGEQFKNFNHHHQFGRETDKGSRNSLNEHKIGSKYFCLNLTL